MKTIVVGVDGSVGGTYSVRYASALAEALGDRAILACVHPPAQLSTPDIVFPQAFSEELRKYGAKLLRKAAAEANWETAPELRQEEGPIAETLVALAAKSDAELIVVGRHSHGALAAFVLGSVADRIAHLADRPVLVVPLDAPRKSVLERPLRLSSIVVGVDGSDGSDRALTMAERFADRTNARIVLVHAVSQPIEGAKLLPGYGFWEKAAQDVARKLVCAEAAQLDRPCEMVVRIERPATLLRQVADAEDADLVVVGRRGRGGVQGLLLGSTTGSVLRAVARPVLVVR